MPLFTTTTAQPVMDLVLTAWGAHFFDWNIGPLFGVLSHSAAAQTKGQTLEGP